MMSKLIITFFGFFLLTACSTMQVQKAGVSTFKPDKKVPIAVIPFYNYTQTPLAGYSAASLANVIMQNHGYTTKAVSLQPQAEKLFDENGQNHLETMAKLKNEGYRYVLTGEVTEWRYKTGIDAQPVVGLVITVTDLQKGETVYSSVGSKSPLGTDAIVKTAQNILDEILP